VLISHDRDFLDRVVSAVMVPEGDGEWTEYAGGYADMLVQRGSDMTRKDVVRKETTRKPAPAEKSVEPRAAAASKRKLTFNDKHALETLPGKIAGLQADLRRLQQQLDDPQLYARDRKAFEATSTAVTTTQAELAAAEERWLELEILREEIEGS